MEIKEGDRVRSYDFEHRKDCYVEGIVDAIIHANDYPKYRIQVQRVHWEGKDVPKSTDYIYPPVNGTPISTGGVTNFVERIES